MAFHVGQPVICIKTGRCPFSNEVAPTLNAIYIIRELVEHRRGIGLRLVEIVNPPNNYAEGLAECTFASTCFRPITERKTDISFAHEILHRVTRKTGVDA